MRKHNVLLESDEMMRLFKEGKVSRNDALIASYNVGKKVSKDLTYQFTNLNYDEIYDVVMNYLLKCFVNEFKDFDPQKSRFSTFLKKVVTNLLINKVNRSTKFFSLSFLHTQDEELTSWDGSYLLIEEIKTYLNSNIDYKLLMIHIQKLLDTIEWKMFILRYIYSMQITEIAKKEHLCIDTVRNAFRRIRRKLIKDALLNEFMHAKSMKKNIISYPKRA